MLNFSQVSYARFLWIITLSNFPLHNLTQASSQVKIGNLALPASQQPGPMIGFGQNIVNAHDLQFYNYFDVLKGRHKTYTETIPTMLYGISDSLSVYVQLPIAIKFSTPDDSFKGVEEFLMQFEYALYNKSNLTSTNQITFVSNVSITTDLDVKHFQRSTGPINFFLGGTASHTGTEWYPFICLATRISPSFAGTSYGNQYFYECGISKNISYKPDTYMLNWMVEFDTIQKKANKTFGISDPASAGTTIVLGPSLWFSTERLVVQSGVSFVVFENVSTENKNKYYFVLYCGYKF